MTDIEARRDGDLTDSDFSGGHVDVSGLDQPVVP